MTSSSKLDIGRLAEVLSRQHGVISRSQTVACGMTDKTLRHRTRTDGPWQRLLPGTYLAGRGSPTPDQRDTAALLYAGKGGVITALAALRRLGLRAPRVDEVDVLVPTGRRRRSAGFVRIRHTSRIPELICADGDIRFVLAARAVADAARGLEQLRDVRAVVSEAVQRGRCRLAELAEELRLGPVAGSALLRQVLGEVTDGVRSSAEADLRDLIKRARLPMPVFNARLYAGRALLAIADAWWPEEGVAAEVDSKEWHLSPEAWELTMRRHARMTAQGILVLHFTPKQIRTEPTQVVAAIRAALEAGRNNGQPQVRTLPATA